VRRFRLRRHLARRHPLRLQRDGEIRNPSREAERYVVIAVVDRRSRVHAGLIERHEERDGVRDRFASDFLVVHLQDAAAAFSEARPVALEIEGDLCWDSNPRRPAWETAGKQGVRCVMRQESTRIHSRPGRRSGGSQIRSETRASRPALKRVTPESAQALNAIVSRSHA